MSYSDARSIPESPPQRQLRAHHAGRPARELPARRDLLGGRPWLRRSPRRSSASPPSERSRWTPSRRRTAGIPARRWAWRRWAGSCSRSTSATTLRPGLAGPRPLRALGRARLDAALRAPAPDRLRPVDGRAEALPPARLRDPRPPRAGRHAGRRDHHGAAGPGLRQRGGLRAGRGDAGRALQPPGPRDRRPPHVVHLLRRRPHGGHLPRGRLDRRLPRARAPRRRLRRQPRQPRRADEPLLRRRHAGALRGLRLAGAPGRGRQRPRGHRRRPDRGGRARRPPDPHRLPHAHRLRRAQQAGHLRGPRLAAGRRGGRRHQARLRLARGRPVPGARRGRRLAGGDCRPWTGAERRVAGAVRGLRGGPSRGGRRARAGRRPGACRRGGRRRSRSSSRASRSPPVPRRGRS